MNVTRNDQRQRPMRRALNDLFYRDGQVEESKFWTVIGKAICAYILIAFAEELLDREYVLLILLLCMIAPDLLKKFLTMRFGGNGHAEPKGKVTKTRLTAPATIETEVTEPAKTAQTGGRMKVDDPS